MDVQAMVARREGEREPARIAKTGSRSLEPATDRSARAVAVCDGVIDIAAALFNVSGKELRHAGRSPLAISRVRQIAMYVTHVALGFTMRDVGLGFSRDRTTVLYACHQIEDMRDDDDFDSIVAMVERVVRAAFKAEENR